MSALWLLAVAGLLGSLLLFVTAAFCLAFYKRRPFPVPAQQSERRLVLAAFAAAILGSAGLFILPAYTSSSCSASLSVTVPAPSSASSSVSIPMSSCPEQTSTFIQVNGPQVIPLFTVPILFAVIPLLLFKLRFRGLVFAVCAFLLAGQAAVGMSGYGLAFAPSSIILVLAGFLGIFGRSWPNKALNATASPRVS